MPKIKFYAVKQGKATGIFTSWPECQASVTGYPNAKFKSFQTEEEARSWLGEAAATSPAAPTSSLAADTASFTATGDSAQDSDTADNSALKNARLSNDTDSSAPQNADLSSPADGSAPKNAGLSNDTDGSAPKNADLSSDADGSALTAYVDGSFREDLGRYAYACVFLLPDGGILRLSGCANDPDGVQIRNVAGEMRGAASAANFARVNGFANLKIFYDYKGIECWADGSWKTNNPLTARYAAYMQSQALYVNITFHKVAAHTGNAWNEEADRLARAALTGEPGLANILLSSYADNKQPAIRNP